MSVPVEIVKALVSPIEKLVVAVQSAIGKIYEPHYIKKIAQAKAYEIELLGNAVRNNSDLAITVNGEKLKIKNKELKNLIYSTQQQDLKQLLKQYFNKAAIADLAYDILTESDDLSQVSKEFKTEWFEQFFDYAKNISDENVQLLWARILAGEINKAGTFSIRTLRLLSDMSKEEALIFDRISKYAIPFGNKFSIPHFFGPQYGIPIHDEDLLIMEECGLVHSLTNLDMSCTPLNEEFLLANNNEVAVFLKAKKYIAKDMKLTVHGFNYTCSGNELIHIIDNYASTEGLLKFAKLIKKEKSIDFYISAYKITNIFPLQCDRTTDLIK